MATAPDLGSVLVVGGCGFLGHHIVKQLLSEAKEAGKKTQVSVLDLRTDRNVQAGASYFAGDITSAAAVEAVLESTRPAVVIHTASPVASGGLANAIFDKVNVGGTENLLACSAKCSSVKAFVYTSSASIAHAGPTRDVAGLDETAPIVTGAAQPEYYSHTKGVAEAAVLAANRRARPDLLTCSIRPAGIFGEGDVQMIPGLLTAYHSGKVRFQIGDNRNLFDFTYVGNIAQAHIAAAHALLLTGTMAVAPLDHERVDGEAFFITNGEPWPWWDFARAVWKQAGDTTPMEQVWVLNKTFMLIIATIAEWVYWLLFRGRRVPTLQRTSVRYSTMTRWYNIDKARRRLAYKPQVGVKEGIVRAVDWSEAQRKKKLEEESKKAQ